MKKSFAIFLTLIVAVSACATATQTEEFPPTPQSSEIPSPTPPPGLTLLPTISFASPSTADVSSLPTLDPSTFPTVNLSSIPTLAPATLWPSAMPLPTQPTYYAYYGSPEPNADCFATASIEGIRLHPGPFISANQLLPTMEPGVRYQVVDNYPRFFQFARDGEAVGWVEYMTTGLSSEGMDCAAIFGRPHDARSLRDFPGLCFFTVNRPTQMFFDSALTKPAMRFEPPSQPFVVLWESRKSIFTSLGHAGPSFYSPTDNVRIFGDCDGIPTSATVTTAGWLLSKPDESQGEKLLRLTIGIHLHIEGKRPPDSSGEAAWVQAVAEIQGKRIIGWVWSGLLTFD